MVKVKIAGEYLDLSNPELSIIRAVNDIANIESRQGSISNDFEAPLTTNNQRILGYANLPNIVYTNNKPSKKIQAELWQNNTRISSGYIQIVNTNHTERTITLTFYGDNIDIFDSLKTIHLSEVDLSRFNHIYRGSVIAAGGALLGRTEGYVYAPVNYGNKDTTPVIKFEMQQGLVSPVDEDPGKGREILPATFVHSLFDQMAYQIGYTIGGSFKNNPIYKKLVLPFSNQYFTNTLNERSYFKAIADIDRNYAYPGAFDLQFDSEEDPSGSFNLGTGVYTAKEVMRAKVMFHMNTPQAASYTVFINGVAITNTVKQPNVTDFDSAVYYVLNPGDTLNIRVSGVGSAIDILAGSYVYLSVDNKISEGSTVELSATLPDLTCADVLKDILIRYGLILDTDYERKIIKINQFSKIKDNIGIARDWSNKLDITEDMISDYQTLVENYCKVNNLLNAEDSTDSKLVEYKNNNNVGFGDGSFSIENDFIDESKDLYTSCFAATVCTYAFKVDLLGDPVSYVYLPRIPRYSDSDLTNAVTPRIAIYYGDIDYTEIASDPIVISSSDGDYTYNQIPFIYFYKENIGATLSQFKENLCFGDPVVDQPNGVNLVDRNYQDYISVINEGNMFKGNLRINEVDNSTLDYSIPIYLQRYKSYYALNKIDGYQGDGSSTPCELIKL